MADFNGVSSVVDGGICTIIFGHPAGNSLPSGLLSELTSTIETAGKNNEVLVILLKSQGEKAFCGGASFDELLAVSNLDEGAEFFSGFANVINAIRTCGKIVVGRVQGKAVGGGMGIAAACDYVLATEAASIKLSELAIGIGPFVIASAVERKIGLSAITEMTLNPGDWRSSEWAKNKGLYAEVFPDIETMDKSVSSFCERLSTYSPDALSELKKMFWTGTDHWGSFLYERAAVSGKLVLGDFAKQALAGFGK